MYKLSSVFFAASLLISIYTTAAADTRQAANPNAETQWIEITKEHEKFIAPVGVTVRYGSKAAYIAKKVASAGLVDCNDETFGRALQAVAKSCYIEKQSTGVKLMETSNKIAEEHEALHTISGTIVRYGVGQSWKSRVVGTTGVCDNSFFGGDPAPGILKACYMGDNKIYMEPIALLFDVNESIVLDLVAKDAEIYSSVPFGKTPKNGFYYLNNNFGKGNYVNGVDYQTIFKTSKEYFPNNSLIEWSWPDIGAGFAFAYPEIMYGGSPYGNPYNTAGFLSRDVKSISRFTAEYNVTLSGNLNSYNLLMDIYLTASPNSEDGIHIAELSFFPHLTDPYNLVGIVELKSVGLVSVSKMDRQILIRPVTATGKPRDALNGIVDWKEIFSYLTNIGWLTGNEFVRSAEFGPEIQVANHYNTRPAKGSIRINKLAYDWK